MRLRRPIVLLVAALACLGLSACRTNVGVAARVGGHTISESTVESYLTAAGPSAATLAQAKQSGNTIQPKTIAMQFLIVQALYEAALRATKGGVPSDQALAKLHDEAAQRLLQAQIGGDRFDAAIRKQLVALGLSTTMLKVILRQTELADAFINRTHVTSIEQLQAKVAALKIPVSVNPRYGSWKANTQELDTTADAGLPSYLRTAPSTVKLAG